MATKIVTKNSSTAASVPTAAQLLQGELAVNVADKRLYTEDNAGAIVELGTNPYNFTANHNGNAKLATTATGIDVTGSVFAAGLTVDGATSTLKSGSSASALILKNASDSQGTVQFGSTNNYKLQGGADYVGFNLLANGSQVLKVSTGGDVSFYEDTGTTAKFFWDASAESLGIGTSSPSEALTVASAGKIKASRSDNARSLLLYTDNNAATVESDTDPLLLKSADSIQFETGGANQRMRIDASGRVGIGVVPSTLWSSSYDALQIGLGGSIAAHAGAGHALKIGSNFVYEGIAPNYYDKYLTSSTAGKYEQDNDGHKWFTAASGTAGNAISWQEAMRIDSSGSVTVKGSGAGGVSDHFRIESTDTQAKLAFTTTTGNGAIYQDGAVLIFATNTANTERMRIDASGNLLVGTTSPYGTTGTTINQAGLIYSSSDGDRAGQFNRTTNNGELVRFSNAGTTVGSIQSRGGVVSTIILDPRTGSLGTGITGSGANFSPTNGSGTEVDARNDIGTSTYRFKDLHLAGQVTSNAGNNTVRASFQVSGTQYGYISVSTGGTNYSTSSDYRLKEDDVPMTGATERVKALRPVNFAWKADGSRVDGFFAHELAEVVPEATTGTKDAMRDEEYEVTPAIKDEEGNETTPAVMGTRSVPDMQGIDQSKLVPLLTATIQELIARIEILEGK